MAEIHQLDVKKNQVDPLKALRYYSGPPDKFWPLLVERLVGFFQAREGLLLVQDENKQWRRMSAYPPAGKSLRSSEGTRRAETMADAVLSSKDSYQLGLVGEQDLADGEFENLAAGCFDNDHSQYDSVLILEFDADSKQGQESIGQKFPLISDIPHVYQLNRLVSRSNNDAVHAISALDLMVLLNDAKHYMKAALTFSNELCAKFSCDRVSLGWLKGGYIELQSVSHMETFDRKMNVAQALEALMEECFDQDEEVVWPRPEGSKTVIRDHARFGRDEAVNYLVSLPLRLGTDVVGVVTCERNSKAFSSSEVNGLRAICDQASRRLSDLKRSDRWIGARVAQSLKDSMGRLVGVENTWAKVGGILASLLLLFVMFGSWDYRVEASFVLRTDDLTYIPVPFDAYIDEVNVDIGEQVSQGDFLLQLDVDALLLQESEAIADVSRYKREEEKFRATQQLADMRIAQAMKDQAQGALNGIRHKIQNARIVAPFDGIVVEGELKKMQGAPVKKGDVLFKVAALEKLYVELKVNERDIHEIEKGQMAEIAFVAQPALDFPVKVNHIYPAATIHSEENVFVLKGELSGAPAAWWRPGMSGVAKIEVGERNIFWVLTHRTVEFLRLFLWL
jgi:hypothetical protein